MQHHKYHQRSPSDESYVYPPSMVGISEGETTAHLASLRPGVQWVYHLMNRVRNRLVGHFNKCETLVCDGIQSCGLCMLVGIAGWFLSVLLTYTTSTLLIPVVMPILMVGFLCGLRTGFFAGLMVLPGYLLISMWSGVSLLMIWSTPLDLACMLILGGCGALTGYMRDVINRLSLFPTATNQSEAQIRIHQMRLRALTARLALDEERKRYGLTQNVLAEMEKTFSQVKQAMGVLAEQVIAADEPIQKARETIEESLLNLQTHTAMISPPMLYNAGLEATLGWLALQKEKSSPLSIQYTHRTTYTPIENDLAVLLYQSVCEFLDNVSQHAQATNVELDLLQEENEIVVSVRDNGKGFDTATLHARPYDDNGFGVFAIQERVSYAGGSVDVQSDPDIGTWVTIRMPIKKKQMTDSVLCGEGQ